jgi:hypothetical protein
MQTNTIEAAVASPHGFEIAERKLPEMEILEKRLEDHERFR